MIEIDLNDESLANEYGDRLRILTDMAYRHDDAKSLITAINATPNDDVRGLLFSAILLLTLMDEAGPS